MLLGIAHTHLVILLSYVCCGKTGLFTEEKLFKNSLSNSAALLPYQGKELHAAAPKTHKAEGFIPLISVIIWTCGLGGLLPAPFFAEIYKQTNLGEDKVHRQRKNLREENEHS